jgi:hypothetical protein
MLDEGLLDRPAEYGKYVISKNAERPSPLSVPLVSHAPHSTDSGDSAYKQVEGLADDAEVF